MRLRVRGSLLQATVVFLCSATILPIGLLAQNSAANEGATLRVSTEFVVLDASVTRKKTGETISDVYLKDFLLEEDGIAQPLTYLSHDRDSNKSRLLPLSASSSYEAQVPFYNEAVSISRQASYDVAAM